MIKIYSPDKNEFQKPRRRAHFIIANALAFCVLFFAAGLSGAADLAPSPVSPVSPPGATCEVRLIDVIRMAVEKDPNVRVYRSQEAVAAAGVLSAQAKFDADLTASVARSVDYTALSETQKLSYRKAGAPDLTKLKQGAFSYKAGYEKKFTNGMTLSPSVTVSTSESNNPQSAAPLTTGKVQFSITKPLGRGSGEAVNLAGERSARVEQESASLDSLYAVSKAVRAAVVAYWKYAYAYRAVQIAEEARARAEKLYKDNKALVEENEVAPAELDQLMANLNGKMAECVKYSQQLLEARNDLKSAAGMPKDSSLFSGPPADLFPAARIAGATIEISSYCGKMLEFALKNRKDYAAAVRRLDSYKFTIPAARDALRPATDLQVAVGYSGRRDDKGAAAFISSLHDGVPGTNVSATLSYSFPEGNRSARAEVIKQDEQLAQARIKAEEAARQIGINIDTRVNAVASVINRYMLMAESGRLYARALQNEKDKNQMGLSTLQDVMNVEDRLGQAELSLEAAVLEYASAIAELRFEAGCLGRMGTSECEISLEEITTLPNVRSLE